MALKASNEYPILKGWEPNERSTYGESFFKMINAAKATITPTVVDIHADHIEVSITPFGDLWLEIPQRPSECPIWLSEYKHNLKRVEVFTSGIKYRGTKIPGEFTDVVDALNRMSAYNQRKREEDALEGLIKAADPETAFNVKKIAKEEGFLDNALVEEWAYGLSEEVKQLQGWTPVYTKSPFENLFSMLKIGGLKIASFEVNEDETCIDFHDLTAEDFQLKKVSQALGVQAFDMDAYYDKKGL